MSDSILEVHAQDGDPDDYEVFRVAISWGILSILAFAMVFVLQMFDGSSWGLESSQAAVATLPLSLVGFVLGLIGIKYSRGQRAARIGVFLNGAVLFCLFVLLPLTFLILRSLR